MGWEGMGEGRGWEGIHEVIISKLKHLIMLSYKKMSPTPKRSISHSFQCSLAGGQVGSGSSWMLSSSSGSGIMASGSSGSPMGPGTGAGAIGPGGCVGRCFGLALSLCLARAHLMRWAHFFNAASWSLMPGSSENAFWNMSSFPAPVAVFLPRRNDAGRRFGYISIQSPSRNNFG